MLQLPRQLPSQRLTPQQPMAARLSSARTCPGAPLMRTSAASLLTVARSLTAVLVCCSHPILKHSCIQTYWLTSSLHVSQYFNHRAVSTTEYLKLNVSFYLCENLSSRSKHCFCQGQVVMVCVIIIRKVCCVLDLKAWERLCSI